MLKKCTCSHSWQDSQYYGKRVMNRMTKSEYVRCTVCEKEHPLHSVDKKRR